MGNLEYRMQAFIHDLEWKLLSGIARIPATPATLEFILQLVRQEFVDELDGKVLSIHFNSITSGVEITVSNTTTGETINE